MSAAALFIQWVWQTNVPTMSIHCDIDSAIAMDWFWPVKILFEIIAEKLIILRTRSKSRRVLKQKILGSGLLVIIGMYQKIHYLV